MAKFGSRVERPFLPGIDCSAGGRTKQAMRDECNINTIMARYNKSGLLPTRSSRAPFYGDVSRLTSYQDGLAVVEQVQELFGNLPAAVRARFSNNPVDLLTFLSDMSNRDEAIKLGLIDEIAPVVAPPAVDSSKAVPAV